MFFFRVKKKQGILYHPSMSLHGPILVTGGAGFIGSRLVRALVGRGEDVCLLARKDASMPRIADLLPKLRFCEGDMCDADSIKRCLETVRPVGIFHLAASNIQSGVTAGKEDLVRTNIVGISTLLESARAMPYRFFVHTGSYLEYGPRSEPMRETDRCEPMELYALTKLGATLLGQAEARIHAKPVVTIRIFSPYGPGMQRGRLLEQMILKALRGDELPMTRPDVARDFIYVDDIAELLLEAAEKATECTGGIFHAASGQSTTLQLLVDEVLRQTDSKSPVRWNAFPPVLYDTATCRADMGTTFARFAWRPAHDLASGLRETIASYRT